MAEPFSGYCMTCRGTVTVKVGTYSVTANKRGSLKGRCPNCKNTVFKIVKLRKGVKA